MNRSILIADDEELIRQGIKARLEYLDLMPAALYEAESGEQAIEILEQHKVDIIITDIRMAGMDGLMFIRNAKTMLPKLQFIILSGYAEFEYAEQAIHLGVNAYLLKPVSNENLKKAIEDSLQKIEEEEALRLSIREGTRSLAEKKDYMLDKAVNELLRNQLEVDNLRKIGKLAGIEFPLENQWSIVSVIHINSESYEQKCFDYKDIDLIKFSIKNVFYEIEGEGRRLIVNNLSNMNQLYVIFTNTNPARLRIEAEKVFTKLQNLLWKKMRVSLTFGSSSITAQITAESSKEAQEAFLQRMIHGKLNLYFYDDIKILSAEQFPVSELHMLHQYIERHDAGNIEFLLNDIFSEDKIKRYNVAYIRIVWARIIQILITVSNPLFTNDPKNMEKLVLNFEIFETFQSVKELINYLYLLILDSISVKGDIDINARNKIKLGIKYIQDNYNRDISITELAEKFAISPNYFSTIFKKETGQTTVNYIKNLRLEKACEYLVRSDKSIAEISKEVGYEDSQYFFRVFKKSTSLTPLEYRRLHRK